jgi:ATP-dependent exoDNAse (exonuclease V) alpha subunit
MHIEEKLKKYLEEIEKNNKRGKKINAILQLRSERELFEEVKKIQEKINKNKINIFKGSVEYKINDKVIQLKNNYEKDVYNGDIGFIKNIDFDLKEIYIDFDGKIVAYDFYDLDEINLSYAISIHKAQGSEFKCVIVPILTSHYMLLQRNLLYTAITRAREVVILIGSKKAIGMAVNKYIVEKTPFNIRFFLLPLNSEYSNDVFPLFGFPINKFIECLFKNLVNSYLFKLSSKSPSHIISQDFNCGLSFSFIVIDIYIY